MEVEFGSGPGYPTPSQAQAVVVANVTAVWDALLTDPVLHDGRITGVYRVVPSSLATGLDWDESESEGEATMVLAVNVELNDS